MLIKAKRYPVWALWSFIVARRLGYAVNEAKSLAIAIANLNAAAKFGSGGGGGGKGYAFIGKGERRAEPTVDLIPLLGRKVYVTRHGPEIRAILHSKGKAKVILPEEFDRKVVQALGENYEVLKAKLERLAECFTPAELGGRGGYAIYANNFAPTKEEDGRPVYNGTKPIYPGRGVPGVVDLERIETLIAKYQPQRA